MHLGRAAASRTRIKGGWVIQIYRRVTLGKEEVDAQVHRALSDGHANMHLGRAVASCTRIKDGWVIQLLYNRVTFCILFLKN
jgi:hypothetical protein